MPNARILLVEDEANMIRTLAKILERKGYMVDTAANGEMALQRLTEQPADIVITDLNMPVMDGMTLLRMMHERNLTPTTIVLTGHGTIQSAVDAMKLGAADYLIKPCHPDELLIVVERLLETRQLRREVTHLKQQLRRYDRFGEIVGKSRPMQGIYAIIDAVSRNKSNVLLFGENGTGKELVARTIHAKSPLAAQPFFAVNCGALAETLLESQLFGHRKGAFTGAVEDHDGVFVAADGGTLFLDEIAEIPLPLQVKFLRAIQEKEVTPLGSTKAVRVDVRIIAATNRDLETAMAEGGFRSDLYYRLNVVSIHLPPLRERRDDIAPLVTHFTAEFSRAYGVEPKQVTPEAMQRLLGYRWPGNIRELQNVIERAFALSPAPEITERDLPPALFTSGNGTPAIEGLAEPIPFEDLERLNILAALRKSGGNKNEAARLLHIDRQRLYRKLGKYGLA
ncbi:MAG: sigma-54-dependent Fis family transcriptional regulator [Deltaproteobacteria bacterium]|nr:sigma-54-dependent Fis family transcriptional regulator [Deltaproteobacteria bacterium]MBI3389091.1 sigma-54-dependent Fis family transcriptional regulator [Deltaproteobacteria bacterium]